MRSPAVPKRPFPQEGGYAHGFRPSNISSKDARSAYDAWNANYLKSDLGNGYYRVEFGSPRGTTVSVGQGYGMILTAYFGDKSQFDGLWKFAQKNFSPEHGLMGWKVTCYGFDKDEGGDGCATDGDTDIGFALVAAFDQWGEEYLQPALEYLKKLKKVDFTTCEATGHVMSTAGNWGGGCDFSNTSYWMPGFYRVFQQFAGDPFCQGKAADDADALYLISRNPKTGLMPNEVDEKGAPHDKQVYVDYNGCRIPWRAVADYLWYGTPDAKSAADRITDWADSVGISKLVDGYYIDGRPKGQYTQQNPWVGGWACGAMAKSQDSVDRFAADFKAIDNDEGGYYGATLRSLYLLMLSGNFWQPGSPVTKAAGSVASPGNSTAPPLGSSQEAHASEGASTGRDAPPSTSLPAGCGGCGCASSPVGLGSGAAVTALAVLGARRRRPRSSKHRAQ